jgi:hypothetical protein
MLWCIWTADLTCLLDWWLGSFLIYLFLWCKHLQHSWMEIFIILLPRIMIETDQGEFFWNRVRFALLWQIPNVTELSEGDFLFIAWSCNEQCLFLAALKCVKDNRDRILILWLSSFEIILLSSVVHSKLSYYLRLPIPIAFFFVSDVLDDASQLTDLCSVCFSL